jgi:predicted dehydrogenase
MKTRSRRDFLASSLAVLATAPVVASQPKPARIRFAAIGLNHGHINGQVDVVTRGGGQLVSCFAKEPELVAAFRKRYPAAALARSEREILEDPTIQLVLSASIPNERAPLGAAVMRHGKDFMVDKPGATTLEQVAEVRRVQASQQ